MQIARRRFVASFCARNLPILPSDANSHLLGSACPVPPAVEPSDPDGDLQPEGPVGTMPSQVPGKRPGFEQVDAGMRSQLPFSSLPPERAQAAWMAAHARKVAPRILYPADTNPNAVAQLRSGIVQTANRRAFAKAFARFGGIPTHVRAPSPVLSEPRRAWRFYNDNAHADRCAPPGRNSGGGAQGQSY
jgi:hypothetical protein